MKIVQISDCHLFAQLDKTGYSQINPYLSLKAVLSDIQKHQPDVVVVSGDISGDDSEQSYQHFLALFEQFSLLDKLLVIPGNHDNNHHFNDLLAEFDLTQKSAIECSGWSIHGLDTRHTGTLGWVEEKDLMRLSDDFQQTGVSRHIVLCHHHPIDTKGWMDKHTWLNKQSFIDFVSSHLQIKLVLYGHIHQQFETTQRNCDYLSCPSSCWQWANSPEFSVAELAPGYRLLQLNHDGSYQSAIYRI